MPPSIKFWYAPGACSLAPHIILNELNLPYQPHPLAVLQGAPPELFKINPKGRVPVLSVDDDIITEVPAIFTALAQLDDADRHLLGRTPLDIVRSYEWMNWISGTLHGQAFGGLLRPGRYIEDEELFPAVRDKALKTVVECYDTVEGRLKGVNAVGDGFTVVDAYLYVFWRWACMKGLDMAVKYPKYAALVAEVVKRDAVRKTLEIEEIEAYGPKL